MKIIKYSIYFLFPFFTLQAQDVIKFPLYKPATLEKKTIWLHACDKEDILTAQSLIVELKRRYPLIDFYISTVTIEAKKTADELFPFETVRMIPHDDLQLMACTFNQVQPIGIILIKHEILPSLVVLAQLKNVPTFLIEASYGHQTERLLYTAPYLYIPLLDSLQHIFTKTNHDLSVFQHIGITHPRMNVLGSLNAFNIVERKKSYLKDFNITEEFIHEMFPFTTIFIHGVDKNNIDSFLQFYKKLKNDIPNVKLILNMQCPVSWKKEICSLLQEQNLSLFIWDEDTSFLNNAHNNILSLLQPLLANNDIIIKFMPGHFFALQAISSLFLITDNCCTIPTRMIIEAAVWKNSVIISSQEDRKISSYQKEQLRPVVKHIKNSKNLLKRTTALLSDKKQKEKIDTLVYNWITKQSRKTARALEPLFSSFNRILAKKNAPA